MAERIRGLEDALQAVHNEHSKCLRGSPVSDPPPHPLLQGKLLLIKSQLELYGINPSRIEYPSPGSDSATDNSIRSDSYEQEQLASRGKGKNDDHRVWSFGERLSPEQPITVSKVHMEASVKYPARAQRRSVSLVRIASGAEVRNKFVL